MSTNPTPSQIRAARKAAKLTQTEAAGVVFMKIRCWQQWEAGDRRMHPALWELFRREVGRRPRKATVHTTQEQTP